MIKNFDNVLDYRYILVMLLILLYYLKSIKKSINIILHHWTLKTPILSNKNDINISCY